MKRLPVFLDTNLLSIFAELDKLDLLLAVLQGHELHISPAVWDELTTGLARGHSFLQNVLALTEEERAIVVTSPTSEESSSLKAIPSWLALGEAESIVVCENRGWIFASNDRRAINYCRRIGVLCLTLNSILAALWQERVVAKDEVREIIRLLEAGGRIIRAKADILKD